MRHIVSSDDGKKAYVSDMYFRQIYEIDLSTLEILRKVQVHNNPNTIALANGKWLFVSCRGKNNPVDYTLRSLENGKNLHN
jgi:DNA-binding beta-propeller fold protein YncE